MNNILVVEDDIKLNQIVCTYLNDNGYAAKGCLNPREAYDLMYNNQQDLIISDIMMPEIDGFQFAESVRDINKTIPILFMTARDDISSKQKGFRAGIDDYMVMTVITIIGYFIIKVTILPIIQYFVIVILSYVVCFLLYDGYRRISEKVMILF